MPERYDHRDLHTGRLHYLAPLGAVAAQRYGALMYNVHRADLVALRYNAMPRDAARLGTECTFEAPDQRGMLTLHGELHVGRLCHVAPTLVALTKSGTDSWYFIAVDCALDHSVATTRARSRSR